MTPDPQGGIPGWALGAAIRAIPGVTVATPVVRATVDLGTAMRDGPLVAVDGAAMAQVVRLRDDPSRAAVLEGLAALAAPAAPGATPPGVAIPVGTRRISLEVAGTIAPADESTLPPGASASARLVAVLVDGDGRISSLTGSPTVLGDATRLEVPLTASGPIGAGATQPVRLVGMGVVLVFNGLIYVVLHGDAVVGSMATSPDAAGGTWTPLALPAAPWTVDMGGGREPYAPPPGEPARLVFDVSSQDTVSYRRSFAPEATAPLRVLVGPAFLDRTGAKIGDRLSASVFGVRVTLDLVGRVDAFPPVDPAQPFVIADGPALDLARFAAGTSPADTGEWWLAVDPSAAASVAATLQAAPFSAGKVVDRARLLSDLAGDPLGLGVIGILGLGSIAALLFAAIGFLVSATVSNAERIGEFALLKALGLSPRQLQAWLSMESVALLLVGLLAGTGLGLVLAWLALPFATLTASGVPPVPPAVVVVPPDALLPSIALAAALVIGTFLLVRRQMPAARTSAVLRARDE